MLLRPTSKGGDAAAAQGLAAWREAFEALFAASGAAGAALDWIEGAEAWPLAHAGEPAGLRSTLEVSLGLDAHLRVTLFGASPGGPNRAEPERRALEAACRRRLAEEDEILRLIGEVLSDARRAPVFCGPGGGVIGASDPVRSRALRLHRGRLAADEAAEDTALRDAIRAAVRDGERRRVLLTDDGEPEVLDVRPALRAPEALRPAAVVLVPREEGASADRAPLLREAFGLTNSEAVVALDVVAGSRARDIATRRGVAVSTVRAQIKAILGKVGVGHQVELVHRLSAIC